MSKFVWALIIGLGVLVILALGATLLFPFLGRGLGFGLLRPGVLGGFGWQFLVVRGIGSFLFWLLVFVGIILIVRSLAGQPAVSNRGAGAVAVEPPLDILKRRYAKGEINREQYEEMKGTLGG